MARKAIPWLALIVACCLTGCASSARAVAPKDASTTAVTPPLESESLTSGGHVRTYLLYVPPNDSKKHPLTLVLVYHGATDTAINATTETNLLSVDEQRHNMILAFLQGYDDTWNEGAGDTPAHAAGINDVAFTSAVLGAIESKYTVDLRRVVATGASNGALLTELLGCRLAANLTLIVPVEGQLPVVVSGSCRPSVPISVYEVHGTADEDIPYGGGRFYGIGGGTTVLSAPASVARWAALDDCSKRAPTSQSGVYVLTGFTGCRQRVTVTLNSVQGGQHVWPPNFAQLVLNAATSLPATRVAVKP